MNPGTSIQPGAVGQGYNRVRPASLQAWRMTAWAAGAFVVLLAGSMFIGHARVRAQDPWKSPRLAELKQNLRDNPKDEPTKQLIRELDLKLRQRYFLQMSRMESGVYLLLGGVAVFLIAARRARVNGRELPDLSRKPDPDEIARSSTPARWSVATAGILAGAALAGLSLVTGTALPREAGEVAKLLGGSPAGSSAGSAVSDAAPPEEFLRNWPRFLGPQGNGVSFSTNAPTLWNATNGTGVAWKTASPVHGFNSPIVWGNRLFFSGGDTAKREVVCLSVETGAVLWRETVAGVPGSPAQLPEVPETTGFAAPTMATDGRRVYVIFAHGDVAAFSLDGKRVWAKYVGPLKNPYGHANSLATWKDRLLLQLDQGETEEGQSKLVALDGRTGETVWQRPRKVGASWASPTTFEAAGKPQVALLSLPWVTAYSAVDGTELWKVDCLNGEVTPSPIFAGGMVIVTSPSEKILAIRPDGQGDVTKSHVAWAFEDGVPDVTTPSSNGELVFMLTTSGMLTCLDAKDGKKVWEHDYETEFHASPIIAGGRVYLAGQKGGTIVVEAAREFKELSRTQMPDAFHASPAIVDGRIFLRGVTNVWCVR